jgi:tetratricopeptide (TPR) repeat protein
VTTSFSDYLRIYNASWLKLQTTSPQLSSYEDRSLYTTWQITFDRIQQQNAAAARLLKLWAYFDRQDVWFELLRHANPTDDQWIQELAEDELNFNKAITLLRTFGLVDPNQSLKQQFGSEGYSMHSCVHSWTVFVLNKEWDESLACLALTCVASEIPMRNKKSWWILQRRLLQHATRQERFILEGKVDLKEIRLALHMLGILYGDQGKLAEAEAMYIRALQGYEEALGPDHISTLDTVQNLGILYSDQGKLAEAEAMYIRALQGYEEALEPDHISTLDTLCCLGDLYRMQQKLVKAERSTRQAMDGYEEALGPKHTSTLMTINNLGLIYADQGKLAEAEAMYIRALQGKEEALGPDHASTLNTVASLGGLYRDQGKLAEAEAMCLRALQGFESLESLNVSSYVPALHTLVDLGDLYSETERVDMAKEMYSRALSGFTTAQGPSSEWCRYIEHRLQVLQVVSVESKACHDQSTEIGEPKTRSLKQTFRRLGKRLNVR